MRSTLRASLTSISRSTRSSLLSSSSLAPVASTSAAPARRQLSTTPATSIPSLGGVLDYFRPSSSAPKARSESIKAVDAKYTPSALRKRLQEDLPDETDSRVIEQRRKQIKETAKLERKAEEDRIRSTEEEDRIAQAPVQVPGFPGVYDVPYLAPQLGPRPVNKEKAERKRRALTVVPKQHDFKTATFRHSPQKLALLARQISGKPVDEAILQMQFTEKRAGRRLMNTLVEGKNHAVFKGMEAGKLRLRAVWVTKGKPLKRVLFMGRGRYGKMKHPTARMHFSLEQGRTFMERQHDRHKKVLRILARRGPSPGAPGMHFKRVKIERMSTGAWRW